jgi:hypothetical protein
MSQALLTSEERQRALERLGYTKRESQFLSMAALHSGYFLRRQYDHFRDQPDGGTTTQLIEKVLAKGHGRAFTYRPRTNIYHLCARPFYDALGQEDNRNRRRRQPLTVKNKLMALDFVLERRANPSLSTDKEKIEYFTEKLRIPLSALPSKVYRSDKSATFTTRYFVDKYPIFLSTPGVSGGAPVASFCFVDEGLTTLSRFETYLAQYGQLFAALPEFRLTYVAGSAGHFEGAKHTFERILMPSKHGTNANGLDPDARRMLDHFEARYQYETRQLDGFDRARLLQLRKDFETYSGAKNETLYARWKREGDHGIIKILGPETTPPASLRGSFSTCLLEHNYDLFGTLTAF